MNNLSRREFLAATATVAVGATMGGNVFGAEPKLKIKKGIKIGMLPKGLSDADKFALAGRCGFEGIDAVPLDDMDKARRQAELAEAAGAPIHGVVFGWWPPFNNLTSKKSSECISKMESALRCAKAMEADTVLLVPTKVTEEFSYADALRISAEHVKKLIPLARELDVVIGIENVWNKFLLSPVEFAKYIDDFESPYVRAYFDIGNVIVESYAQHWIRTLGSRIVKLDVKDFKRKGFSWENVGDGDVNWAEVRKSLGEINYSGWATAEVKGGDEAYLTDLVQRMDRVLGL
jgi:hexulose-6-phosphate isomerase